MRAVRWLSDHAWVVTAVTSAVVAAVGFRGGDFAAQDYRVWVFKTHGFLVWDLNWYGGHSDLGYSVLFPAVGAVLGTVPATAAACVASTLAWGRLVGRDGAPAITSRLWFAVLIVGDLIIGRAPFACSVAAALGAVLAVREDRRLLALLAALVASLFSPLGAFFLLLVALAWWPTVGWRRVLPLGGAAVGVGMAVLVGDGGWFPFPWTSFVGQLVIAGVGLLLTPRTFPVLRRGLAWYGVACVPLFLVPTPIGGNMARFSSIVVGPLAAYVLWRAGKPKLLAMVAAPLLAFQLQPVIGAIHDAAGDPSSKPAYYAGMLRFLEEHQQPPSRVEIPFTLNHWEATYVAEKVPLARGWERQIDLKLNAELYRPLTAGAYLTWLRENAVRYVALSDAPLDEGGEAEGAVLRHPPSWLRQVYADAHWRIWEVEGTKPLAEGVARMVALSPTSFTLHSDGVGLTLVRVRWSPYWQVEMGTGCFLKDPAGWTEVVQLAPGALRASLRLGENQTCTSVQLQEVGLSPTLLETQR
ncbi:MAG: hypothetical protein IRZ02_06420 [Acidothermus sp.]|nr:hypothetical protein [Acidothermus sp.]